MVKVQKNTVLSVLLLLLCSNYVLMDSISLIRTPIEAELADFKNLFDSSLSSSNALLDSVVSHIRQRNGKMMRPILVLLVARLYGAVRPSTLHAAVSLELLHTASLVHDDVVDESTERRGQLSVNAIFNNKVAVLTGDYLLATSLVHAEQTHSHPIIQLVSSLGQDLADGELLQLSNVSNHSFSESVYFDVIRKKTAALFAACTKAAAFSVGVGEEEAEFARLLGEYIGICFQIKDDIFDYFDSKEIGKPTGNDMLEGKLTLPALYVLNSTKDSAMLEIAIRVKEGTATPDEIARLIGFIKENGGIEYAVHTMNLYKQKAFGLLASLPDSDVCAALRAYLDYVVDREK
jgi:octaprenyl-diphosphate synthase